MHGAWQVEVGAVASGRAQRNPERRARHVPNANGTSVPNACQRCRRPHPAAGTTVDPSPRAFCVLSGSSSRGTATQRAGRTKRAEHADGRKGKAGKRAPPGAGDGHGNGNANHAWPAARAGWRPTPTHARVHARSARLPRRSTSAWQCQRAPPRRPFHARTPGSG